MEKQLKEEGVDPSTNEGKKAIARLRREQKAAESGQTLGKAGRPKSQKTLELETQLKGEGVDPSTNEGKKRLARLRRLLRSV